MKAILCEQLGGTENLRLREIDDPTPGREEVTINVHFAGLNFFDLLTLAGQYQYRPSLPFSPGWEGSGTIAAIGEGVTGWRIGDRVAVFSENLCREKAVVPMQRLLAIPDNVTELDAAALVVTYGTSFYALRDRAGLKPGETLAVLGAAGGVGLAAVELGKAMGAKVIACASSSEKLALAETRGADFLLNYSKEDVKEGLRRLTNGKGVDVVFDPIGGQYTEPALRAMGWGGRYLVVGFASGDIPHLPLNLPLLKGCDIRGVFWTPFIDKHPEGYQANMQQIFTWKAEEKLSAHIHSAFPLTQTAEGLNILAHREAQGKIVVSIE